MASEPGPFAEEDRMDQEQNSDMDAEFEEDEEVLIPTVVNGIHTEEEDAQDSDVDAEGEVDDDFEGQEGAQSPMKPPKKRKVEAEESEADSGVDGDDDVVMDSSANDAKTESDRNSDTSSDDDDEEEEENEWEAESEAGEEAEIETVDPNRCIFCGQDEEHDPGEEYEEYLACAVCGDNSHRQCARDANSLGPEDEPENWRCSNCVENDLQPDVKQTGMASTRRRSSAPKITRDLLPAHRGAMKPDSHSVFNTLILDDDPMDGSRSLRKRKASDETAPIRRPERKRRRPSDSAAESDGEIAVASSASPNTARVVVAEAPGDDTKEAPTDEDSSPKLRRTRRIRQSHKPLVTFVDGGLRIVSFNLDPVRLQAILSQKPRKKRSNRDKRKILAQPQIIADNEPSHYPAIQSTYMQSLFLNDRESDELKKPYGGILSENEADTSKTFPEKADRERFERARLEAETMWKKKTAAQIAIELAKPTPKTSGTPSKMKAIYFGGYEIDIWHTAPYPEEYNRNRLNYICEFCLRYHPSDYVAWRHKLKCPAKHPPGDEIYRDGKYSFFEVDGRKNPSYCQNLCLLAKLFLGSKTLYYDVEPFLFYIMTENDEFGCHFVGYFSKEKRPSSLNNVSCILVLPIHQRKGFGHFLIEFSYLLTRVEQKTGSPEKPLSDMGLVSYRGYWRLVLCKGLLDQKGPVSISTISERTGMTPDDIVSTLEGLRALVRDPVTKTYALRLDYAYFREYIAKNEKKAHPTINPNALIWVPYVMGRNNLNHYEDGPAIHTVAQREDEEDEEEAEEGVQMEKAKSQASHLTNGESQDEDMLMTPTGELALQSPGQTNPSTPKLNGAFGDVTPMPLDEAHIPPSRFQVYPPLKGHKHGPKLSISSTKRRSNRPFGSRRKTITPRSASYANGITGRPETPTGLGASAAAIRRTRSNLAEVVNGVEDSEAEAEDKMQEATHGNEANEDTSAGAEADDDADGEADAEGDVDLLADGADGDGVDIDDGDPDVDAEGEADEDEDEDDDADADGDAEMEDA